MFDSDKLSDDVRYYFVQGYPLPLFLLVGFGQGCGCDPEERPYLIGRAFYAVWTLGNAKIEVETKSSFARHSFLLVDFFAYRLSAHRALLVSICARICLIEAFANRYGLAYNLETRQKGLEGQGGRDGGGCARRILHGRSDEACISGHVRRSEKKPWRNCIDKM